MSDPSSTPQPIDPALFERALHAELERRVAELATYGDADFGNIGLLEGAGIALLFIGLPLLAVVLAA